nr:hypothetical protein [Tanacetum cinerariifolium]
NFLRVNNLVGFAALNHAILVDAAAVCKGVGAHDSLIGLHRHAHEVRHEGRRFVRREDGPVDAFHVLVQVLNLGAVFVGQAVAGGIGDVEHCGPGRNHCLAHAGQKLVIGAAGIFGVKLHVFDKALSELH